MSAADGGIPLRDALKYNSSCSPAASRRAACSRTAQRLTNSSQNVLLVNEDFRVCTDLVKHFVQLYEGYPGVEKTVPDVVKEWYAQQLVEAVLGVVAVRGSAELAAEPGRESLVRGGTDLGGHAALQPLSTGLAHARHEAWQP